MAHTSSRYLRWWWLVPLILVALVAAAVALMPWNFLKPFITEQIEATTGRSAAIQGTVTVDFFPRPRLSLHDVELDNPLWAASPRMFTAQRLSVSPSLGELIRGEIVLDGIEIDGMTLNLEQRVDAPSNWVFDDRQDQPSSEAQPANEKEATSPVRIRHLSLSDADINYLPAERDTPYELTLSSLEVQADDETLHAQAALTFQEQRFELEAETDPFAAFMDEAHSFAGELSVNAGESRLSAAFKAPEAPAFERFQVDGELSVQGLADWLQWGDLPPIDLERLDIAARLERQGSEWRFNDIATDLADSSVTGELSLDTGGDVPTLNGRLHAPQLDVAALRAALPASGEDTTAISVPVLPELRGELALSVERLTLEQGLVEDLQSRITLAEHTLTLESATFAIAGSQVEANARLTSRPETVAAKAQVNLQDLSPAALDIPLGSAAVLDAEFALELLPLEQRPTFESETLLANLRIANGRMSYRNEEAGSDLEATLATATKGAPELMLALNGTLTDKPIEMEIRGGPLTELVNLEEGFLKNDYRLEAEATSGGLYARVDTRLDSLLQPRTLDGDVVLEADDGQALETWIGPVLPPLPEFRLAGNLSRDDAQWSASGLEGEIASTPIAGSVEFHNTERPVVNVDLEAGRIDLARFIPANSDANEEDQEGSLLAPLRGVDGQFNLEAQALVLANGLELGNPVLNANLEDGRLQADPLQFRIGGGSLVGSLALDANTQPASGRLNVNLDQIALSQLTDTFTPIEDRLGRLSGNLHLEMRETLAAERRDDLLLPFIGQLMIEPSELRFNDPQAGTELTLALETQGLGEGEQTFQLEGDGRYDGAPASLSLRSDPLLDARDPSRPYAVDLEAEVVDTRLQLQGTLLRPLALEGLDLELALEGPNPQRLNRLLGVPLPELPAYSVSGNLELDNQRLSLTQMEGTVGSSDLDGWLALDGSATPPRLTGELTSRDLDIEDLGVLAGATPDPAESGAPDDRFILPDDPIIGDAWHAVSAEVSFRGQSVRAGNFPLSNVVIDFRLEDGRGQFDPVGFGIGEGSVDLILDLDAGTRPPSGTMQVEVQGVDLKDALRHLNLADESVGTIGGRGKLWVEGASIDELLASADGGVVLLMTGGRMEALLVEMAGLDAGQTFLSWLRGREAIPIDCAYADLQVRDGITELDTFLVDTDDTTFTIGGQVDLNTERLDISIIPHPKDPSLFVGRSPLHLGGTFDNIDTGVHGQSIALRSGASVALGALAGPIAALLPLVGVGTGIGTDYCQGLISRSREAIDEGDIE
ncbi:MAG: AsmA family protein [Halomonas sp.]|uniref:AsmA family protein n=1 Tax=Halomonas sp. TaxID=1486246 RepID=UPI002ACE0E40|nr:AsmA family protein [Halomonas sp.]MDZ7852084.1 AsmA family protein [Halomonas sp.]